MAYGQPVMRDITTKTVFVVLFLSSLLSLSSSCLPSEWGLTSTVM